MPVEVGNGQDRGHVAFENEEHTEGKPVEDGAPDVREDRRTLQWPVLDALEGRAHFAQETKPELRPLAFVPHAYLLGVELGLRPNDQSGHLPIVAESGLYPLDDFPPRAGLTRGLLMCRKPLTQERLLPLMEGHLVDGRRDGIPERLHVIDLFVHR